MQDELVQNIARLMREQATAYRQLESATEQLSAALVRGEPDGVQSRARAGESELIRMRARLCQIMSALTMFAETRARAAEQTPICPEAREEFEKASRDLMAAAETFQRVRARAAQLASGGSNFAVACIEQCGLQPVTYRAPYATRRGTAEAGRWV